MPIAFPYYGYGYGYPDSYGDDYAYGYPDSYGDDYAPGYSTTYIAPAYTTTYAAAPYRNYGYQNYAYRNYGYGVRHAGYGYGIRHGVGGYGVRHAGYRTPYVGSRSGLAGTGADMLGRDMDVALGKPVLSHRVAEQAGASREPTGRPKVRQHQSNDKPN